MIACRDLAKGEVARNRLLHAVPGAAVHVLEADTSDFDSVRRCAAAFREEFQQLDHLILNAGAIFTKRCETASGLESTFATNHLGHFLLTLLLLPCLAMSDRSVVTAVTSYGHRFCRGLKWDDLHLEKNYRFMDAYAQSKLANILFIRELNKRLLMADLTNIVANAAAPGFSITKILDDHNGKLRARFISFIMPLCGQSAAKGALPILTAAIVGGRDDYWAPGSCVPPESIGAPRLWQPSKAARDEASAQRLWDISERLVGHTLNL